MGDRVLSRGGVESPNIEGQGCLAQAVHYPAGGDSFEGWIFENAGANPVGDGTTHPIGMTLDHLMELYWRFRELRFVGSIDTFNPPIQSSGTQDVSFEREIFPPSAPFGKQVTREGELVLSAPWYMSEDNATGDGGSTFRVFDYIDGLTPPRVLVSGGLYYPALYMSISAIFGSLESLDGGGYTHSGDGTLTMSDGTVYTIPLYHDPQFLTTASGSIAITCEKYWEHAKADGNPKYNVNTGVKL